jgi:hypothetical protein
MTDVRLISSGNIRLRFHLTNAFANYKKPTPAEMNAGVDLVDAVSWNEFSFAVSASNTNENPAISARGKTFDRGAAKFGGKISFYLPKIFDDLTNLYAVIYNLLGVTRQFGFISMSIDGEVGDTAATYTGGAIRNNYQAGDFVHIFAVESDAITKHVIGEDAFRYTVDFLPQGSIYTYAVVGVTNTVIVTPSTIAKTVIGGAFITTATLGGRPYSRGMNWTTSDATKASVSSAGVITPIAAGTVTITATDPAGATNATCVVTLT